MFAGRAVQAAYAERFPRSQALYQRAKRVIPGGLTHDSRYHQPFPLYVDRVDGPYKWTVEGHRLIDYWMGHGAVVLGHNHPAVVSAVQSALANGTHFSAGHELEIQWAEQICQLLPSAEMVRFTASGSESVSLALRLSRAFTGRRRILRLQGHFHGWHDEAAMGSKLPFAVPASAGVHPAAGDCVTIIPANDAEALGQALAGREFAALIMEPTGASWGTVPLAAGYLEAVRAATRATDTVLIFDEVITGFRLSPGGAQQARGVTPDLTTLAKIVAGGLPSGAVAGRAEILSLLAFRGEAEFDRYRRVAHQGTFNANPIVATAGLAALRLLASGEVHATIGRMGMRLRDGMNGVLRRLGLPGCVYGEGSMFHIYIGKDCPLTVAGDQVQGDFAAEPLLRGMPQLIELRQALQLQGVDLLRNGGLLSLAHSEGVVEATVAAFEAALRSLL